jgi:hypothetical protein
MVGPFKRQSYPRERVLGLDKSNRNIASSLAVNKLLLYVENSGTKVAQ